jgi:hypothetical protein
VSCSRFAFRKLGHGLNPFDLLLMVEGGNLRNYTQRCILSIAQNQCRRPSTGPKGAPINV